MATAPAVPPLTADLAALFMISSKVGGGPSFLAALILVVVVVAVVAVGLDGKRDQEVDAIVVEKQKMCVPFQKRQMSEHK